MAIGMVMRAARAAPHMQASQEVRVAERQAACGGEADARAEAARAEFRDMFVSLVDPAGLLDMDRCSETAGRMRDVASGAGYAAGETMAAALCDIFAGARDIVNRPVEDGALNCTYVAFQSIMPALYETAEAYRDGRDSEPVGELEWVRGSISRLRATADARREYLRGADPPGSRLTGLSVYHRGQMCRDVVRKEQERLRAWFAAQGDDPVFPPKFVSIDEFLGEFGDTSISSAELLDDFRGKS